MKRDAGNEVGGEAGMEGGGEEREGEGGEGTMGRAGRDGVTRGSLDSLDSLDSLEGEVREEERGFTVSGPVETERPKMETAVVPGVA